MRIADGDTPKIPLRGNALSRKVCFLLGSGIGHFDTVGLTSTETDRQDRNTGILFDRNFPDMMECIPLAEKVNPGQSIQTRVCHVPKMLFLIGSDYISSYQV